MHFKMIVKVLYLFISTAIFAFASPVVDKLALARRFGPLKKVVSLEFLTKKTHDIVQFNPGKIQVRFRPGQTEKVQNFVS